MVRPQVGEINNRVNGDHDAETVALPTARFYFIAGYFQSFQVLKT